jgi:hypothetical protein
MNFPSPFPPEKKDKQICGWMVRLLWITDIYTGVM